MKTTDGNGRICPFCGGSGMAFRHGLEEIENEAVSDGLVKRLENEARKHSRESELYADLVEAARFIAKLQYSEFIAKPPYSEFIAEYPHEKED